MFGGMLKISQEKVYEFLISNKNRVKNSLASDLCLNYLLKYGDHKKPSYKDN